MGTPEVELVLRYHQAVAAGATGDALAAFFTEDAIQRELPNLLFPSGNVSTVPAILAAAERGQKVIADQRYEVRNVVSQGDRVAVELEWSGTLKLPYGDLPAGHVLRAHIGAFLDIRDGKISGQRNYDCYEPLIANPDVSSAIAGTQ